MIVDKTELVASSERMDTMLVTKDEIIADISAALAPVSEATIPVKISIIPAKDEVSPAFIVAITLLKASVIAVESKPRFAIVCIKVLSIVTQPPCCNYYNENISYKNLFIIPKKNLLTFLLKLL